MTEGQQMQLDREVLAALKNLSTTFRAERAWISIHWLYTHADLTRYTHREVDHALTRLHGCGEVESYHKNLCHGGEEVYYRLAPAGGKKE